MKNLIFRREVHKKTRYRVELPEKGGAWAVYRFKGGPGKKEGGGVLRVRGGGVDTPMHTMLNPLRGSVYPDAHLCFISQFIPNA